MTSLFRQHSQATLDDPHVRRTLARSLGHLRRQRMGAFDGTTGFHLLREAARAVRQQTLADLPQLLEQLEAQLVANGVVVHWAEDAAAANRYVLALAEQAGRSGRPGRVVKSRSSTAEEIGLRPALEAAGVPVTETQLGDYILQLAGEPASHPVYPVLHKRKEDVAALFEEKLDMPQTLDVQVIAGMARFKQRREFLQADVGVFGVNFAVAETGTLAVITDGGNDRLLGALARVQVGLMGIDKVVPTLEDLFLLAQLQVRSGTGRPMGNYVNLINGPARTGDPDGPAELHLVLLDNGRSRIMELGYGEALACIRCSACLNVCPVFQEVGGQAYGAAYAGPIGSVLIPLLPAPPRPVMHDATPGSGRLSARRPRAGSAELTGDQSPLRDTPFVDLPHASTLCGACAEVCPVGIDIPGLLKTLRADVRSTERTSLGRRAAMRVFAWSMASPQRYRWVTRWLARFGRLFGRQRARHLPPPLWGWTRNRDFPLPAGQSFHQSWAKR